MSDIALRVNPIPEGYRNITPYLTIKGASDAIEFYKKVFGAEQLMRLDTPDGKVAHSEIKIGDSKIMIADEFPNMAARSPKSIGGSAVTLHFYTEKVDEIVEKAIAEGAVLKKPIEDQFYGDRTGWITDPFGHEWCVATHVEDVPEEEIRERAKKAMAVEKTS